MAKIKIGGEEKLFFDSGESAVYKLNNDGTYSKINTGGADHSLNSAAVGGTVTPSDATVLDFTKVYVGTGGDVSLDNVDGTEVIYKNVPGGVTIHFIGNRVNSTNTTATNMTWDK